MTVNEADDARAQLLALSRGYVLSRAIHVAAELGIADHVTATAIPVAELARRTSSHAGHLERLMRFLAGHQIFSERAPGEFVATPLSDFLRDDCPTSLRPGLRMVNTAWWAAVGDLGHSVKTGEPAFALRHPDPFFAYLKGHPDDQLRFDEGMASNSRTADDAIARAYDFSTVRSVVDLGGGRGGLVRAILARFPGVTGVVFDQPQVIDHFQPSPDDSIAKRLSAVAGDFFAVVPTGADVYLLKGVLHDFDDDRCLEILRSCRRAMGPESRLLVIERLITPDDRPHEAKTIDLLMMALLGGRERALPEWETLLRDASLKLLRRIPTGCELTISEAGPE